MNPSFYPGAKCGICGNSPCCAKLIQKDSVSPSGEPVITLCDSCYTKFSMELAGIFHEMKNSVHTVNTKNPQKERHG